MNRSVPVHHLAALSWTAFRQLASRRLIALLPLGAIEAHGPHLPLGTDIVIAEAMARAGADLLDARGFDVVVLPTLPMAPAPFAAAFAGTIDTAPAATASMIEAVARSLQQHGVRAVVIANAHHDPAHVAAIRDAVAQIQREQPGLLIFPDLTRRRWASRLTDEFQSGACHAGRYETSVVLAADPSQVASDVMRSLAPNPQSLVAAIQRGDRTFVQAGGPDAYFGAPSEASAQEGREIIERLGRIIEDAVIEVLGTDADRQPA
jgi:creatinine amidohydrolase